MRMLSSSLGFWFQSEHQQASYKSTSRSSGLKSESTSSMCSNPRRKRSQSTTSATAQSMIVQTTPSMARMITKRQQSSRSRANRIEWTTNMTTTRRTWGTLWSEIKSPVSRQTSIDYAYRLMFFFSYAYWIWQQKRKQRPNSAVAVPTGDSHRSRIHFRHRVVRWSWGIQAQRSGALRKFMGSKEEQAGDELREAFACFAVLLWWRHDQQGARQEVGVMPINRVTNNSFDDF